MRKRSKDFITHRDLRISKFNSRKAVAPCMGEQEDYLAALEIAELKGLAVPSIIANALDECIEKHSTRRRPMDIKSAMLRYKSYKMEDEMISGIGRALRHSANDLRDFGLSLSEKWLREQLIGLRTCNVVSDKSTTNNLNNSEIESDITYLAQSLLGQGEYLRCTHLLRKIHPSNATPLSRFLYCYSCYMAGEKIKTQKKIENVSSRNSSDGATLPDKKESLLNGKNQIAKNPNLRDLFDEMYPVFREFQDQISSGEYSKLYSQQQSSVATSSIKMNGLQMYLFAIVVRDLIRQGGGPIFLIESSNPLPYPAGINDSYDDDFLRNIPREDVYADKMGGLSSAPFPSVYTLFSYAAHLFPCNWSCWLELSAQCIADQRAPPEWDDLCTVLPDCVPTQAPDRCTCAGSIQFNSVIGKVMYQSFLAHHFVETQQAVLAMEILTDLVYLFPDSQIVAAQVALAHFSVRSYDESEAVFLGIREADPYRLDHLNVFSNILFVKDSKNQLSDLAHRVVKINKYAPETCVVVGNYYAIKGNHERAILYFQRALRLNDRFLEAWTLMGHEYLELMNASAAIEAYRGASDRSPTEYRAWYGLGQAYEMLHLFQYSLYYHKKAAALCPSDARTWCAVGICYSKLGMKTDAILALDRAVQCGDNEGVATRELARLYRDAGELELAADCYRRHLLAEDGTDDPLSTQTPYLAPQDEQIDPERAEALLFLASHHRGLGELDIAEKYGSRLMDYTGPAGDEARALLREIRSLAFLQTHSRGSRGSPYVARSSVTGVSAHSPRVSSPVVNRAAAGATQRQNRLAAARADSDQSHTDFSMDQESSHDV